MKCQLIRNMTCVPTEDYPDGIKVAGTEIDHPEAFILVQSGVATPADEECRKKAGMTEADMAKARKHYERAAKGIHPEDFAAYDRGEMDGYNGDGTYKPGPNAVRIPDDE